MLTENNPKACQELEAGGCAALLEVLVMHMSNQSICELIVSCLSNLIAAGAASNEGEVEDVDGADSMSGGRSYSRVLEEMLAVHAHSLNTAFLNQAQDVYGFLRNIYI